MSADAITVLEAVRAYLTDKLLPTVPASQRSDLRAAAKLIDNALGELDMLHPMLQNECAAMERLCREAESHAAQHPTLAPMAAAARELAGQAHGESLTALRQRHGQWSALCGDLALALQAIPGAEAARQMRGLLELLGSHALARARWQSVFPADKPFSDIFIAN